MAEVNRAEVDSDKIDDEENQQQNAPAVEEALNDMSDEPVSQGETLASIQTKKRKVSKKRKAPAKKTKPVEEKQTPEEEEFEVPRGREVDGVWFSSVTLSRMWDVKKTWVIIPEKKLVENTWNVPEVIDMLKKANLFESLTSPKPSIHQVVHEFAANIPESFGDPMHDDYGVVYVRRARIFITPELINNYLGITRREDVYEFPDMDEIAKVITGGKVTDWRSGSTIKSRYLSSKYAVLHSLSVCNWIPTKSKQVVTQVMGKLLYAIGLGEKVDFGMVVFDNWAGLAAPVTPKRHIGHPSLAYELIKIQAPQII